MPYIKHVLTITLSIDIISMDIMALSQLYLDSAPMAHSQLVQGVGEGGHFYIVGVAAKSMFMQSEI